MAIALPSIGYSHGEADATSRVGPQARVVYVPPAAAPDAYLCSVSCAPKQAPDYYSNPATRPDPVAEARQNAEYQRQMADYWENQSLVPPPAPVLVQAPPAAAGPPAAGLCDADYYRNSNGNCVHRPEQAPAPPAGATAKCADGKYSFSQHRQGTCSDHGGVAQWL